MKILSTSMGSVTNLEKVKQVQRYLMKWGYV